MILLPPSSGWKKLLHPNMKAGVHSENLDVFIFYTTPRLRVQLIFIREFHIILQLETMKDLTFNNRRPACGLHTTSNTCSSSGSLVTKNKDRSLVFLVGVAVVTSSRSVITSRGDSLNVFPEERLPDGDCATGNPSWREWEERDSIDYDENLLSFILEYLPPRELKRWSKIIK
jgi:hypothetical protein